MKKLTGISVRTVIAAMILAMLLGVLATAWADTEVWTCVHCGQTGNNGSFCPNCGTAKPAAEWTCEGCGQTGNTGNFCPVCGNARQEHEQKKTADPVVTADQTKTTANIQPGYHFYFGSFEQDGFQVNGEEPIVWQVLEVDQTRNMVLAISEYGLYTMKYHRNDKQTRWSDTDVRNWLNSTFLASFSPAERNAIIRTTVSGSEDDVFLLNSEQITRYLRSPYICYATPWALSHGEKGAYINEDTGGSSWLVRTDVAKQRIAWVGGAGQLYSPEGKRGVNHLTTKDNVVRPAIWVTMDAVGREATDYGFPLYARAIMDIATRSGPTTGYTGLGSYKVNGQAVRVLSRVNDGSIWWLQIEFEYNNKIIRCYTGLKRVGINISRVPDEPQGTVRTGIVIAAVPAYYGPGKDYKEMPAKLTPEAGTYGTIISETNGWVCFEYDYPQGKETARVWMPAEAVQISR